MQQNLLCKTFSKKSLTAAMVAATTLALSACGGGGGGSTASTPNPTTVQVPSQPIDSTNTAPVISPIPNADNFIHTVATAENAALAIVNKNRTACGFGNLAANSSLKNSAYNHANYMGEVSLMNKYEFAAHQEKTEKFTDGTTLKNTGVLNSYYSGEKLFDYDPVTGKRNSDRLSPTTLGSNAFTTSYNPRAAGENIATQTVNTQDVDDVTTAQDMIIGLFAAPYHIKTLVYPHFTEIGVNYVKTKWTTSSTTSPYKTHSILEMVSTLPVNGTYTENSQLLNFPCGNVTTAYELTDEYPNPFGEGKRDLKTNPIGQPVYVLAPNGKVIKDASINITNNGQSVGLIHKLTQANDPNGLLKGNEIVFMPDHSLKPSSTYQVTYQLFYTDGTNSEIRSFSFITQS